MPLNFPNAKDIPLRKAPLRDVICQVRFPLILRIVREEPAAVQERIRQRFPLLEAGRGVAVQMRGTEPQAASLGAPVYHFYSRDRTREVSLGVDFFAVTTTAYVNWEGFADDLSLATEVVQDVYGIQYATRIGLRYVNVIDATFVESGRFEEVYDLLRPELTAMLRSEAILAPESAHHRILVADGNAKLGFAYALVRERDSEGELGKPRFVLDFDYYIEGDIDVDALLPRCTGYHQVIYNAFRWCIADGKLDAFEPVSAVERGV